MITKPCPFCSLPNSEDSGGACCFCDYQGDVQIGKAGHFDNIDQYNKVADASIFKDKIAVLVDANNPDTQSI